MHTEAAKRYLRRSLIIGGLYIPLAMGYRALDSLFDPSPPIAVLMAVLIALPIAALLTVLGLYLREETDEFMRDRAVTAILIATGVLLIVSSIVGVLQYRDLVGMVKVFPAFPIWCFLWAAVQFFFFWRDSRDDGAV